MSWCDKLASTPVVGVRFMPSFVPAEEILSSWRSILQKFVDEDRPSFGMESIETFAAAFNTEDGYKYSFDHSSVSINFNHRVRAKLTSGGPPIMELLSRPAPYTELLDETISRLTEALGLIPNIKERQLRRVGVVSVTNVDLEDAPPGILALIERIAAPIGGEFDHMNSIISTKLCETDTTRDRCIHTITTPEDNVGLARLLFDWQRRFVDHDPLANSDFNRVLKHARDDALAYFERIGEGGLDDAANGNS